MTTHRIDTLTLLLLSLITIMMIPLCYSVSSPLRLEQFHAFARCPNGTHKSPSGTCEQVVPHEGLPRCPNGFHRSPNGTCEAVNGAGSNPQSNTENNNVAGSTNGLATEITTSCNVSSSPGQCDQSLWNHVNNPTRLQIVESCKTVTGTIDTIRILMIDLYQIWNFFDEHILISSFAIREYGIIESG